MGNRESGVGNRESGIGNRELGVMTTEFDKASPDGRKQVNAFTQWL